MKRFPDGIGSPAFYQKSMQDYYPSSVELQPVERTDGSTITYPVINNKKAVAYLANMVGEFHIWLSRAPKLNYPDRMIFDLDPSSGVSFTQVKWAAGAMKKLFDEIGLSSFIMTTGSRGLHVIIPIKQIYLFDEVKLIAQDIATLLIRKHPALLTMEISKKKRGKKIFIDTLRNAWAATTIAPYSVRAIEGAPVATPITWKELSRLRSSQQYTMLTVPKRLQKTDDVWHDMHKNAQSLKQAVKRLAVIMEQDV